MTQIRRSALVKYSPAQMYALVTDVQAYPKRFGWCVDSAVQDVQGETVTARLELKFAGIRQGFTTRNIGEPPQRMTMQLVEGPFRKLEGVWSFEALGERGCKVSLVLDFDYAGRLGGMAFKLGFQGLANRMVDDFCTEAAKAYG
ncbi:type II toxin-antitoxin system RatA family toxin [Oleiagrimonas sp. C23AA]|uniref:SRPBCC family protein n=1 Tax=Oleiagrimonas sp. C23AA TaxID=2719047 RepID=UPI001423626E|nr:type II toxin-antitoxin system RatA family toxin [Oleiagrimonas sp. C23AA]